MEIFLAGLCLGLVIGIIGEKIRKVCDLKLDAKNGVTFVGGIPHVFKRYGPEQNYDD